MTLEDFYLAIGREIQRQLLGWLALALYVIVALVVFGLILGWLLEMR